MDVIDQMLEYGGQAGMVPAYLARPDTGERRPGSVLIHDIFGLSDHTKDVARRFVGEGYVALAPHLFARPALAEAFAPGRVREAMTFASSLPRDALSDRARVRKEAAALPEDQRERVLETVPLVYGGLPREEMVQDLVTTVDYLTAQSFVRQGRIGSAGFCFGGGMSFALACRAPLAACVVFYGENPEPIERIRDITCPVLGLYGAEDMRINAHLPEMMQAMVGYQKELELKIYPNAAHAFFKDTSPQSYRPLAAAEAWERVLRFYRTALLKA